MSALISLEGCAVPDDASLSLRGRCYPVDTENVVALPVLTDPMRLWLNAPERRTMLTWRVTVEFAVRFGLTAEQTGHILSIWCKEISA